MASTDYTNKDAAIALAKRLGRGMTVFKHPDRSNFNITHTNRRDRYLPDWVVHQT